MSSFTGSWDLTVHRPSGEFPSWLSVSGEHGQYVGIWGSARPISGIQHEGDSITFELPSQYEGIETNLRFQLTLDGDECTGWATIWDAEPYPVSGRRAPDMHRIGEALFGEPIDLLAEGIEGFQVRWPDMEFNWSMQDGVLVNSAKGTDIISNATFEDFRLEAEYSYPEGSNSGIYLRGRYEFQILDDYGQHPSLGSSAAIYGFFAPTLNAVNPANEWNRAVVELIGRRAKVKLNGTLVLDVIIPGITGGALDSNEGLPGPILLQGDHGPVSFRKLTITPISFR